MTLALDEIYIKTNAFIEKLHRMGYPDLAELVYDAKLGGSTGSEILFRIHGALYCVNKKLRTENELLAFEARQVGRSIKEFYEEFHGTPFLIGAENWYD